MDLALQPCNDITFVFQLCLLPFIERSLFLLVKIFSTLCGHKSSLVPVKQYLTALGVQSLSTTGISRKNHQIVFFSQIHENRPAPAYLYAFITLTNKIIIGI